MVVIQGWSSSFHWAGLEYMRERVGGCGGLIVVDKEGRYAAEFTTERMPWAAISGGGQLVAGFRPGERKVEIVPAITRQQSN